jgi:hypothetical protein
VARCVGNGTWVPRRASDLNSAGGRATQAHTLARRLMWGSLPSPRPMLHPCPKPVFKKRPPTGLRRGAPLRAVSQGSAFPKRRHREYCAFVRAHTCLVRGRPLARPISPNDYCPGLAWRGVTHVCWGPIEAAHVGEHQATGAPDLGACIPLCRAAHRYYDEHRVSFYRITGRSPADLEHAAAGLALRFVERGGTP